MPVAHVYDHRMEEYWWEQPNLTYHHVPPERLKIGWLDGPALWLVREIGR